MQALALRVSRGAKRPAMPGGLGLVSNCNKGDAIYQNESGVDFPAIDVGPNVGPSWGHLIRGAFS